MAAIKFPDRVHTHASKFKSALTSASLEWLLIFMLFLDAIYSYLVTKFASYCELQTPCLLCSRLDYIFGCKKPGFYWDLICAAHKSEISLLVSSRLNEKFADTDATSENCGLLSDKSKTSDPETHKSLVGKLGQDLEFLVDNSHLVVDRTLDSFSNRQCPSCNGASCNGAFSNRNFTHKSIQTKSDDEEHFELRAPLDMKHYSLADYKDVMKKKRAKSSGSYLGSHGSDPLSHVAYSELKVASESESEFPFLDEHDGSMLVHEGDSLKEEYLAQGEQPQSDLTLLNVSPKTLYMDLPQEKLTSQAPAPELLVLVSDGPIHEDRSFSSASIPAIGHGLEELNGHQAEKRSKPFLLTNSIEAPEKLSEEKYVGEAGNIACKSCTENSEVLSKTANTSTNSGKPLNHSTVNPSLLGSSSMDLNDAYKLAVGDKGSNFTFIKPLTVTKTASVQDDLKMLLSQISASRRLEFSWSDVSIGMRRDVDDIRTAEASPSFMQPGLMKRFSIERNESGFESLDGSLISEIEGESAVDRLKRQIERDRKSMSALYKELEEERSASAIAAHQALAMINRLQEEKAAMQMEALQYQRMMEDQAEYDQEALQKASELLFQREKELQDLEAELESHKRKFEAESVEEKIVESMSESHENGTNVSSHEPLITKSENNVRGCEGSIMRPNGSVWDFEDEKLDILNCLKRLEKKLYLFSNHGIHVEESGYDGDRDEFPDKRGESIKLQRYYKDQIRTSLEDISEENGGFSQNKSLGENVGTQFISLKSDNENVLSVNDDKHSKIFIESGLISEISSLNERLEILEADRNFLEHTINSLRNENGGVQFVQEIASDLRELRRLGMRSEMRVA